MSYPIETEFDLQSVMSQAEMSKPNDYVKANSIAQPQLEQISMEEGRLELGSGERLLKVGCTKLFIIQQQYGK